MTKNPIVNALSATLYISAIVSIMFYGQQILSKAPGDTVLAPIAFISLFTLSAAVMGYLFLSQPAQIYFEGKKKEAVNLFLKTVASFGVITLIALALLFSGVAG